MHWLAALSPLALAAGCPQRHRECSPREGQFGVRKTNAVTRRDLSEGHPPTGTNGPEKDNWQAQKRPMHARAQASAHPGARALALTPRGSGVPAASWVGQRGANARTHTHTHDALTHTRTHTHRHTHAHTHRLGERRICLRKAHRFALLERQRHLVHARHGQVERLTHPRLQLRPCLLPAQFNKSQHSQIFLHLECSRGARSEHLSGRSVDERSN
jgi:hypothetical protein